VIVASSIVLALFACLAWFVLLPNYRPSLGPDEVYGIDVSGHQGDIDWNRVARAGISFAYIKATEGADFVDPKFKRNWTGAGAAGLPRGSYHFFSLCSSGAAQAARFLGASPRDPNALAPAIDLELRGNCHERPKLAIVERELADFLRSVEEATGRIVILYLGTDFADHYRVSAEHSHPLWLRRVLRRPAAKSWVIWQVDGNAHIDGIRGDADLDVASWPAILRDSSR
jgi:lysozyme